MKKLTLAQRMQNKANIRNVLKGSLSVLVCLLNKDFREDIADYTIASAKENVSEHKADLKHIELYPAFTVARRAILNLLDTVQLNICVDVDHLSSDTLKGHLQKSIDLSLKASGWTQEEFDAITNIDQSTMTISNKIAYVLAYPKEESLYSEGMTILLAIAQPFMETYERMGEGMQEVAEQAAKEANSFPKDEKYVRLNGAIVLKERAQSYTYSSIASYLSEQLHLDDENINTLIDPKTNHYELPTGTMVAHGKLLNREITYVEYNKIVAELIAGNQPVK